MFEEIISALQGMNIGFEEMEDQGMLSVEVGEMDKMQLIEVLNMVNSMGMTVTELTETNMTLTSPEAPAPELEPVQEEDTAEDVDQMAALDEAIAGM